MTEAKCGSLAMYSIARGWHSENRVISVTSEGEHLRKVYTHGVSSCPYGVIHVTGKQSPAWPPPAIVTIGRVRQWLDSMGLYTAGAVTIADPCEEIEGVWYPSISIGGEVSLTMTKSEPPIGEEIMRVREDLIEGCDSMTSGWT